MVNSSGSARFLVALAALFLAAPLPAPDKPQAVPAETLSRPELSVDALSVVKVRSKAVANARSLRTLGPQREA